MSATFKNAKKKLIQSEFRRLVSEHKGKNGEVKKIDSPLAKYNDAGQLTCILCKSVVRSENVWAVHINSKQHRENVELAKKLKERTNNFTVPLKRPLTPPMEVPQKKLKSILKNSKTPNQSEPSAAAPSSSKTIPDDFFDSRVAKPQPVVQTQKHDEKMAVDEAGKDEVLPEGFFDDPKLDAKARNQEYKDPVEEEWEKFQKEIKEADNQSAAIIAEDQEESTNERQLDEIEEQMKMLTRVLDLEKAKDNIATVPAQSTDVEMEEESADEDKDDFDEYLDWRCKKAYK